VIKKRSRHGSDKQLFVLDTNVLMHDPTALFRFHEHDVYLPMIVLEELDRGKKGVSEVARNVRQVSRFLDELMCNIGKEEIDSGLPLPAAPGAKADGESTGRLFFQTREHALDLPRSLPGTTADNSILATTLALQQGRPEIQVTLVSKDINLRIKAAVLGIQVEDYFNDQALDDVNLLYHGATMLPEGFWEHHVKSEPVRLQRRW
jgi:PhoH-like ATPase